MGGRIAFGRKIWDGKMEKDISTLRGIAYSTASHRGSEVAL